ncbi:shikimate dehydrogenase [Solimonas sp. K1W22B-7]|uniref:shikimate dehydrogenase n=1 Tax=Solimonas sp. K1W22B-7 TaxID=2303331 RepID=UPI000E335831|nr:shikimate dehydrogenase [Solimonas sp. K1W22B-7]AXQ27221.1 shikimate dehydrogenase [Solimonas sp. K1W22B-7]
MDRYAVIGFPVSHSKSPLIHARFARQTGQELGYEAIEIAPAALAERLAQMHAEGYRGCNATLPHKLVVAKLCEQVSERAQLAGAVNTLLRTDSGWRGDNSDGEGFIADLRNLGLAVAGRRVLLLGTGGAARGILKPLLDEKPAELVLSGRNPWKPEEIAEQFKPHGRIVPRTHASLKGDLYDLVINATSVGHQGAAPRLPGQLLAPGGACYDLSYGPAHAPFAAWARSQGAALVADGLGMLVEQAAVSFELWRGVRPQTAGVVEELRRS